MPGEGGSDRGDRLGEQNSQKDPGVTRQAAARPAAERIGSAEMLQRELSEHRLPFRVEARGGLAILTSSDPEALAAIDPSLRARLLDAARRAGFTHVAVEIADDPAEPSRETLPGHQSP